MSANPEALRRLPSVDQLLRALGDRPEVAGIPRPRLTAMVREVVDAERRGAREADHPLADLEALAARVVGQVQQTGLFSLRPVINATGVVLHTNLGRALLSPLALERVLAVGAAYSNLEMDVATKERGSRYSHVEGLLRRLTGAEDALVVNNNAAAVLLALETLAHGKEVIVSRGELIEIGGEFRIPDIMRRGGAVLREVGATNRTHLRDYAEAINPNTALLLKVHTSNYRVIGFTADVSSRELTELGRARGIPVMEDLGSGSLIDLRPWGFPYEPTVPEVVASGVDLVTFSGRQAAGRAAGGHRGRQAADRRAPQEEPLESRPADRQVHDRRAGGDAHRLRGGDGAGDGADAGVSHRAAGEHHRTRPASAPRPAGSGGGAARRAHRRGALAGRRRRAAHGGAAHGRAGPRRHRCRGARARRHGAAPAILPVIGRLVDDRLFLDCRTVLPGQVTELLRVLTRAARA